MYGVAVANVQIGGGVPRIQKHGFCAFITMQHIWEFNVTVTQHDIEQIQQHTDNQSKAPIVLITRIKDNI